MELTSDVISAGIRNTIACSIDQWDRVRRLELDLRVQVMRDSGNSELDILKSLLAEMQAATEALKRAQGSAVQHIIQQSLSRARSGSSL